MHFITYGTNQYTSFALELADQAVAHVYGGFESKHVYNNTDLPTHFQLSNANILSNKRGDGYWLWKPFIIMQALLAAKSDDIIVYCDSMYCMLPGNIFYNFIANHFKTTLDNGDVLLTHNKPGGCKYLEKDWTKARTFDIMNSKFPINSQNSSDTNQFQVWAGFIAMRKSPSSLKFISEWLAACQIDQNITDEIVDKTKTKTCIEHRHDQSILSLLAKSRGIPFHDFPQGALIDMYVSPPKTIANQTIFIRGSANGLGDRILDVIGSILIAKYTNSYVEHIWHTAPANIYFENSVLSRQYNLEDSVEFKISRWGCCGSSSAISNTIELVSPNSAFSLSPLCLHQGILKDIPLITLSHTFKELCRTVIAAPKAINVILDNSNIKLAIGIHLRRTDKIIQHQQNTNDIIHAANTDTYDTMMENMLIRISKTKPGQLFFICSDDIEYVPIFKSQIMVANPTATFMSFNCQNPSFDLFALSQCSEIYQATLHSSFSLVASLVGNIPIVNFMDHEPSSMIHVWKHTCDNYVFTCDGVNECVPKVSHERLAYLREHL